MSKTLIIVIVVLACLLVIFVIGVGVGLGGAGKPAPPEGSSLKTLGRLIGGRRPLDLDDVVVVGASNPVPAPGTYTVPDQDLKLEIVERKTPMRLARLSVSAGSCVVSIVPRDEDSVRIRNKRLAAGEFVELNIPRKGADIVVTRAGQQSTEIRIEPVQP